MAESPQVETANTLTIDFQDNPDLREIFGKKEVGDKCKLTIEVQLMSRYPEGVQCAIEKVITEDYGYGEKEAVADEKEPIQMVMRNKGRKNRGMSGPHEMEGGPKSRAPQTAMNSAEPWLTSYT